MLFEYGLTILKARKYRYENLGCLTGKYYAMNLKMYVRFILKADRKNAKLILFFSDLSHLLTDSYSLHVTLLIKYFKVFETFTFFSETFIKFIAMSNEHVSA